MTCQTHGNVLHVLKLGRVICVHLKRDNRPVSENAGRCERVEES